MGQLPQAIVGEWVHSHEEDTGGVEVYRPAGYLFPPSRGRRGFALHEDGSATYRGIGADDRPTVSSAHWSADGPAWVRLTFDDDGGGGGEPLVLEILHAEDGRLEVRRR